MKYLPLLIWQISILTIGNVVWWKLRKNGCGREASDNAYGNWVLFIIGSIVWFVICRYS